MIPPLSLFHPISGGGDSILCVSSRFVFPSVQSWGFPSGTVVKKLPANAGDPRDVSSISGLGRSPGGGQGNSLQYSCLGNPKDRGAWWAK